MSDNLNLDILLMQIKDMSIELQDSFLRLEKMVADDYAKLERRIKALEISTGFNT